MDMDQAATFLAGSVLTMIGFVVVIIGIVVINNILYKYWKPMGWFKSWGLTLDSAPPRFAEPHELDKSKEPKVK
jgi:hypothetical protein